MPDLSAAAVLDFWQSADGLPPVERSLALAVAGAEEPEEVARLPLGRRDARLLALHTALSGSMVEATAACPGCGEQAEFAVDAAGLLAGQGDPPSPMPVEVRGFTVDWRCPDSLDVAAAAATRDPAAAERALLSRCVLAASGPEGEVDAAFLPTAVREAVAGAMAEADPLAEVLVDVVCPFCARAFVADLDVGSFVWAEVRARALHLLHEVDVLARAYGWSEPEVLSLDDRRRAAYLALASGERP